MSQPASADGRAGWSAGLGMPGPDPEVTVRRAGARPAAGSAPGPRSAPRRERKSAGHRTTRTGLAVRASVF